ncbi:MAG: Fic family protein [Planctomycetota bacterium]|nr:Fic family protein [Planctomycetota bacterium]
MAKPTKPLPKPLNQWNPEAPYNELPLLPPTADLETKDILKQCITARAALAELKQAAELIPNQGMLINTVPLLEAQASSEIENIVTTTDRLFQFRNADDHADPATKEALRYSHALLEAFREMTRRPLSTSTAEQVCSIIKGKEMLVRRVPGTALSRGEEIIYTPPVGEDRLRKLLANWEKFLHDSRDLDPLIRMSVGHYQFEAIHPFTDGNGRTGRVLNGLFLIQESLLTLPILYLSRFIIQNKADYYRLLRKVTSHNAWEEWVLYMLRGVEETAYWTTAKIGAIRKLTSLTAEHMKAKASKIYSLELVHLIFEMPYCRIQNLVEAKICERQAASRYLKQLVEIGVLEEQAAGREKVFLHPKLLTLLTRDGNVVPNY